jgi:hydrogenase nickel incorporation protein HypA/HybF
VGILAIAFFVHELSICGALLTQVAEIALSRNAQAVARITIELGPLSGVEPSLLSSAFAIMRLGSIAADAELLIEVTGVSVRCLACGAQTETVANRLVCGMCGGFRTQVIAGDELRLRRIEMQVTEPRLAATA